MKARGSIRSFLKISLIILSITPLLLLGGILLRQSYIVQKQHAIDLQRELSMLAMDRISSYIREQGVVLNSVARNTDLMSMDRRQQQMILSKLLSTSGDIRRGYVFNGIKLLDGKGRELISVSRRSFLMDDLPEEQSQPGGYATPSARGEVSFSPVYFNRRTGEPFLRMSLPIMDMRTMNVGGMLVADLRMEFMREVIAGIRFGESGSAFITDQNGRIIAHRNPSVVLRGAHFKAPVQAGIATGLSGTKVVLAAEKMRLGRQSFSVITELPVGEALKQTYRSLFVAGVFMVLTVSCALFLGFVLVQKIVRPVESLANTAQAITNGDISQKAEGFRNDETGALADAFNVMTSRLLETITSLNEQIVERIQGEEELLRQNELLNNVMNSLTHPFYVIDAGTYTITMANSASHFGDLTEGRKCYSLTHKRDVPCDGDEHPCTIKEVVKTGNPVVLEHTHFDSACNAGYFNVYGYPIFDGNGNVSKVIEYTIDVTEKKKLEQQLLQAQKMEAVGNLAGGIAHDFNNLLCAIIGYSELLMEEIPEDQPAWGKVSVIMEAGKKAEALTRQLLAFSRRQVLEIRVINLNGIVENMTKILSRVIGENIRLEISEGPGVKNVKGDPGQIEQVLMNLAINARDAMPTGGRLIIETQNVELDTKYVRSHPTVMPGAYVMLAVTDTGLGMGRDVQKKIFEPFFTTKGDKGTGLGLSTVYGIVKQHGGAIYVYSEPGMGSTFKIYLPSTGETKEESEAPESSRQEPVSRSTGTILIVDDEPSVRRLIVDTLQPSGYRVLDASSAKEALQIIEETGGEIDVLFTDLVMPGMNGLELARTVRTSRPSMRVIITSGYTDNSIFRQEMIDEGMTFVQKPITPKRLMDTLNSVVDKRGC
jgi:nitrogen-specific signal transduction histidine kinase/CheY-like chemotaxis protein/HAMP domain-containing protein